MSPEETLSTRTLETPSASSLECPACGTNNSLDSKFCRQCGHLLRALGTSDVKKPAPSGAQGEDGTLTSPAEIDARRSHQLLDRALLLSERGDLNAALLACRQAVALDSNHAEPYALLATLLERSGDLRGAMNAYERVLQISPNNTLERDSLTRLKSRIEKAPTFNFNPNELFANDDDTLPSVAAPEAVEPAVVPVERDEHGIEARLPPTSASLRVPAAVAAPVMAATVVATPAVVVAAPVVVPEVATPQVAAVSAAPLVFEFDEAPTGATPSVSPLAAAMDGETVSRVGTLAPVAIPAVAPSNAALKIERREKQRRQVNVPVATERRTASERRAPSTRSGVTFAPSVWPSPGARPGLGVPAPVPTRTPAAIAPLDFSFGATAPVKAPLWAQMMRGSSFFARTLPLMAVGIVGLGFLSWARSQAVARDTMAQTGTSTLVISPDGSTTTTVIQPNAAQTGANLVPGGPTVPASNPNGSSSGFPITNATPAPVPATNSNPASAPATNPARPASSSPRGTAGSGGGATPVRANGGAGSPNFPLAPAPVPPAPVASTTGGNGSGGNIVLPPPQTQAGGTVSAPIPVGSLGSTPLNPSGSPQQGRIRITQGSVPGRPVAPPRSGTLARGDERAAAAAAAAGNQGGVINNLNNALGKTGTDQGFLLQQRAMAFLDRGDSARAVEDFQAAINAYQDQINRGENVAAAQSGIRAARAGLGMAQSRR